MAPSWMGWCLERDMMKSNRLWSLVVVAALAIFICSARVSQERDRVLTSKLQVAQKQNAQYTADLERHVKSFQELFGQQQRCVEQLLDTRHSLAEAKAAVTYAVGPCPTNCGTINCQQVIRLLDGCQQLRGGLEHVREVLRHRDVP